MTSEEEARLGHLQGPWCPFSVITELYGLDLENDVALQRFFGARAKRYGPMEIIRDHTINRHRFELLLQASDLSPRKWTAARLGMTETSLVSLIEKLTDEGLMYKHYIIPNLLDENFERDLMEIFKDFKFRTFSNHNSFCRYLHQVLEDRLGFRVDSLLCVTSVALKEDPADYAHDFDAITLDPIGPKYKVWLDLRKPMNLRPDFCSMLLYARERRKLRDLAAGTGEPEIPASVTNFLDGPQE